MLLINAVNAAGRPVELFVKDGKIAAVGQDLSALAGEGETVLDAGGLTVLPAFVDLHCHWRTPGFEYKEDIATGSMAAAAGGYTFVNLMPNTKPVCSSAAQAAMVEQKAAEVGLCDVNQTVSITENFDGKTIDHLKTLPASVKFITEDGHGVQDNATMARAFAICTQRDITVMSHAEDMEISPWDYRLAEDLETVRNCWLSEYYQTRLHMCHVSTRGALEAIQMAKLRGAPVTCEVTPHHLWFNNETCDYRVNPPIRTADDVQALIDGIRSGVVDAIATDHAPHSEEDKLKGMGSVHNDDIANLLDEKKLNHTECVMYRTVSNDFSEEEIKNFDYDMMLFFSPTGVKALKKNFPNFEQGNIAVGAFGPATAKTVEDEGLRLDLEAPNKAFPSMTGALADYLKRHNK